MQNKINGYYDRIEDVMDLHLMGNVLYHDVAAYRALERVRVDPFNNYISERQFKARYRFNKRNCNQLVQMVIPYFDINNRRRGQPVAPQQIVCSGLDIMAGGHFFRVNGYGGGLGTSTAWRCLYRLTDALLMPEIRERFLHMPTQDQQAVNMRDVFNKYGMHNIIGAVDGCHIPFLERPRNLPPGRNHVTFINRKGSYSINAQIVGGMDRRIYDILLSAPGSFHDAAVWQMSQAKAYLSTLNPRHYVLGDAAYPISDHCLTPYSENEAQASFSKALFNIRHSGARVEQPECIYGMLKRRFPIVKNIIHIQFLLFFSFS